MLTIELRFPTGKWHATPWGRQVNEGAVEWPPSPWRLLRTLIAVWHHKFRDVPEAEVRELIEALSPPPVFHLPPTSDGHTRHYMPVANDKRAKIFDTFLAVSPQDAVLVGWPDVTLTDVQRSLLDRMLAALSYFGRAESWVTASLGDWDGHNPPPNAYPLDASGIGDTQELVRLLLPTDASTYAQWRTEMADELGQRRLLEKQQRALSRGNPSDREKLTKADLKKIDATLPADLFDALHAETNDLRKAGWNRPPGSEWVDYVRDKPLAVSPAQTSSRARKADRPTVARFAVAGAVRPRLTETLWIAERVRTSLIKISDGAALFVGRDTTSNDNAPASGHLHAHYLCESNNDSQGRITHLAVYAPEGIGRDEELALQRFHKTWGRDGHDLQFVLLGLGHAEDFGGTDERKGQSPVLATSDHWVSRTPFVPADRLRRRYNLTDEAERHRCELDLARMIRAELHRRPWLNEETYRLSHVQAVLDPKQSGVQLGGNRLSWLSFRRTRQRGGGRQGSPHGYGFRLTFDRVVQGPLALGYGAHFGLGLFVPETTIE